MILRFIPLEGSEGRRGKVFGEGDCPEEGDYLTLTFEGQEYDDYQVTFPTWTTSGPTCSAPSSCATPSRSREALVVLEQEER
jgi:hypothetical protein